MYLADTNASHLADIEPFNALFHIPSQDLLGRRQSELNMIVLHLGMGASAACIERGKCVDTSMGMTPLEGLVMETRCGDLDPGVI